MARVMEAGQPATAHDEREFHADARPLEQSWFSLRTVVQILATGIGYYLATRAA